MFLSPIARAKRQLKRERERHKTAEVEQERSAEIFREVARVLKMREGTIAAADGPRMVEQMLRAAGCQQRDIAYEYYADVALGFDEGEVVVLAAEGEELRVKKRAAAVSSGGLFGVVSRRAYITRPQPARDGLRAVAVCMLGEVPVRVDAAVGVFENVGVRGDGTVGPVPRAEGALGRALQPAGAGELAMCLVLLPFSDPVQPDRRGALMQTLATPATLLALPPPQPSGPPPSLPARKRRRAVSTNASGVETHGAVGAVQGAAGAERGAAAAALDTWAGGHDRRSSAHRPIAVLVRRALPMYRVLVHRTGALGQEQRPAKPLGVRGKYRVARETLARKPTTQENDDEAGATDALL
jgi:hypothetical protein